MSHFTMRLMMGSGLAFVDAAAMGSEVVSGPGGGVLNAASQRTEGLSPAFRRTLPDAERLWEFGANG